jgi:hypothetical protein
MVPPCVAQCASRYLAENTGIKVENSRAKTRLGVENSQKVG